MAEAGKGLTPGGSATVERKHGAAGNLSSTACPLETFANRTPSLLASATFPEGSTAMGRTVTGLFDTLKACNGTEEAIWARASKNVIC